MFYSLVLIDIRVVHTVYNLHINLYTLKLNQSYINNCLTKFKSFLKNKMSYIYIIIMFHYNNINVNNMTLISVTIYISFLHIS